MLQTARGGKMEAVSREATRASYRLQDSCLVSTPPRHLLPEPEELRGHLQAGGDLVPELVVDRIVASA